MKTLFFFLIPLVVLVGCKKALPVASVNTVNALNKGVPGNTAYDLLNRMSDATGEKAKIVILMIGTNDANVGDTTYHGHDSTFTNYQQNLSRIIDTIKNSGSYLILVTPPPYVKGTAFYDNTAKLDTVCAIIRRLSTSKECGLVDLNVNLSTQNNHTFYLNDGLHLNPTGYALLSKEVVAYIKTTSLNVTPTDIIVCFGDSLTYGLGVVGQGTSDGDTYPSYLKKDL